jgi:hypothetical protein
MPRVQAKGQHLNVVRARTRDAVDVVEPKRMNAAVVAEKPHIFSASCRPAECPT